MQEPQFQGQTKDRLNNPEVAVGRSTRWCGPALEHWLNQNTVGRRGDRRRASSWRRGPARPAARRSRRSRARARRPAALNLPGKLSDCTSPGRRRQRAVHRRGRLGRRLGQAGARPRAAGDPAAARQGAEHRERVAREGAGEQGAVGPGHGARLRPRQGLRPRRGCATARSSSWPTPTPTATTSRRCC